MPSDSFLPTLAQRNHLRLWLSATIGFLLLGFMALPLDVTLAAWVSQGHVPDVVGDVLDRAESFAHGIGIAMILLVIYVIDVRRRWTAPRVLLAVIGGGMAANIIKLTIYRLRPGSFDLAKEVGESFQGWLPLFAVENSGRSTPSAHTAAVVALAIALSWLYPRGRWLFATLAVLGGLQRVSSSSHFLSDVFWGAAVGWFIAQGVISGWLTGPRLLRWENRKRALACQSSGLGDGEKDHGEQNEPRAA
ncbi:MAG: phosphatase PAP2 family protein [Planctomycetales bacterium]